MRDQDCSGELLRSPTHNGHLLVGALKRHQNKPVLFLGDTRLTGGQLADRISQYIQAFEALGAGTGVAVGLLSLNRPEVLMIIGEPAIEAMTAEIQAAVKQRKGSVQAPKRVVVVDSLPLTGLGKPDKKAVRARFWEGAGRAVG